MIEKNALFSASFLEQTRLWVKNTGYLKNPVGKRENGPKPYKNLQNPIKPYKTCGPRWSFLFDRPPPKHQLIARLPFLETCGTRGRTEQPATVGLRAALGSALGRRAMAGDEEPERVFFSKCFLGSQKWSFESFDMFFPFQKTMFVSSYFKANICCKRGQKIM